MGRGGGLLVLALCIACEADAPDGEIMTVGTGMAQPDSDAPAMYDDAGRACEEREFLVDPDGDSYAADGAETSLECAPPRVVPAGFALQEGDCGPTDPGRNPGGEEICGDWVDDDCDGEDAVCPTTEAVVTVPDWDCSGQPPDNVVAVAHLGDGGEHYAPGGCFAFFFVANAFYVAPIGVEALEEVACGQWDERLYAFTVVDDYEDCEPIEIDAQWDHENPPAEQAMQPVSNHCRKFLHAMLGASPFTYATATPGGIAHRIRLYPKLELACARTRIHTYPWKSLLIADIEINQDFNPF